MPKIVVVTNRGDVVDEIILEPPIGDAWSMSLLHVNSRITTACQIAFENEQ